ncbi:MAG: tagaturonate reductase [Defluviitaleaceae bacterium]|nr:tagaturonate reductase [Defluviitaleaceae bacterium]
MGSYNKLDRDFLQRESNFLRNMGIGFHINKNNTVSGLEEKVLQFGEGNFLRAFMDSFIDKLNIKGFFNGRIAIVQPIPQGMANELNAQGCCYTVVLRGLEGGKPVASKQIVTSINRVINPYTDFDTYVETMKNPQLRYIISNTTEAGIAYLETDKLCDRPPASFPGKVTALLYERYKHFGGDMAKGFIFLPCELIDNSGDTLKEVVLCYASKWKLPDDFITWVDKANYFANTLVDRIVTGYPRDEAGVFEAELGYKDDMLVTGEIFHFFAIEAPVNVLQEIESDMPFKNAGLNVVLTSDVTSYKMRKVRILNGSHTMSVLAARLAGIETVGEMMGDPLFIEYLKKGIYEEIIPTLDLDEEDLMSFAASVFDRFSNPHIKHYLLSIALNSVSKFKARVLPTIYDYYKKKDRLPDVLTFSFAALIAFYKTNEANDSPEVLEFFNAQWQQATSETCDFSAIVSATCAHAAFWDTDLNKLPGFAHKAAGYLQSIQTVGVAESLKRLLLR